MRKDYVEYAGDDIERVYFPRNDKRKVFNSYEEALREALILRGILKPVRREKE